MNTDTQDMRNPNDSSKQFQDNEQAIELEEASSSATTNDIPAFGWSSYAERVNGRFAMIGFSAILIIETFSHQTFMHWAGLIN